MPQDIKDHEFGMIRKAVNQPIRQEQDSLDIKDVNGTFKVKTYVPRSGDDIQIDDKPLIATNGAKGGARLAMEFAPEPHVRGDRVALLQFFRCLNTKNGQTGSYYTGQHKPHSDVSNHWFLDFNGSVVPFFQIHRRNNGLMKETTKGKLGKKPQNGTWTPAFMADNPTRTWRSNEVVEQRFVTAAVSFQDVTRPRSINCYLCGLLTWGWRISDSGRVSLLYMGFLERLPKFVEPVLEAWGKADEVIGRIPGSNAHRIKIQLAHTGYR